MIKKLIIACFLFYLASVVFGPSCRDSNIRTYRSKQVSKVENHYKIQINK